MVTFAAYRTIYADLYREQRGRCAICGQELRPDAVAMDHDHATGYVRGLLCSRCNTGLGWFQDDCIYLEAAHRYLRDNSVLPREIAYPFTQAYHFRTHRRPHGTGTITQRGDGRWEARMSVPGGKRKSFYGKTRAEVERLLREAQRDRWAKTA